MEVIYKLHHINNFNNFIDYLIKEELYTITTFCKDPKK
jgi:hypothetical protein